MASATGLPFVIHEGLHVWLTPPPPGVRDGVIQSVRSGPKGPLVKISGIDDIDSASRTRGCALVARPADLPELEDIEVADDPVGLELHTDTGEFLGMVVEVIETGANDVWIVQGGDFGQVLLPVIDDVVLQIDEEARTALVHLLPGLVPDKDDTA